MASPSYSNAGKAVQENGSSFEFIAQHRGMDHVQPASSGPSFEFLAYGLENERVKSSDQTATSPTKKRKVSDAPKDGDEDGGEALTGFGAQDALAGIDSKPKRVRRKKDEEKRLRVFRKKAPLTYLKDLSRVKSQRMFLINRKRSLSEDRTYEEEVIDLGDTAGNIYQVTVTKQPHCTCPDGGKGSQCKHIIYVLVNVLKAREELAYQLALLSTELTQIFANAPRTPQSGASSTFTFNGGQRKPIEGDCPICVTELAIGDDIIWCKGLGACGNNLHRECFEEWAKSKSGDVRCVHCQVPWKGDEESIKRIAKGKDESVNHESNVKVGSGLSFNGHRDFRTYQSYWPEYASPRAKSSNGMPVGLPAGTVRQGNAYVSPRLGVYDLEGEYAGCDDPNHARHPNVPVGSEWNGFSAWTDDEGGVYSVDGDLVGEC